jgi:hypothetical protein
LWGSSLKEFKATASTAGSQCRLKALSLFSPADQRLLAQGNCRATAAAPSGHIIELAVDESLEAPTPRQAGEFWKLNGEPCPEAAPRLPYLYHRLLRSCATRGAWSTLYTANSEHRAASGLLIPLDPSYAPSCVLSTDPVFRPRPCHPRHAWPGLFLDDEEWEDGGMVVVWALPNPWVSVPSAFSHVAHKPKSVTDPTHPPTSGPCC